MKPGDLSGWLRWKVVYSQLQRAWEVWGPRQLWPRLNPAALPVLAARAAWEGSSLCGREQGGEVEERHRARPVFAKSRGYSWISNRADAGWRSVWGVGKRRKQRLGSSFVSAHSEGQATGTELQCHVLGGSSLLQGKAADVA